MHAVRSATRPKLSLVVPAVTAIAASNTATLSALTVPAVPSASVLPTTPVTPTARNTQLNARGFAASALAGNSAFPAPQKKRHHKRVSFSDVASVTFIAPLPQECYGHYPAMSRDERRWGPRQQVS